MELIQNYVNAHREEILEDLIALVQKEAPTSDVEGLKKVRTQLKEVIEKRLEVSAEEIFVETGRHVLSAQIGEKTARPILLMGHYDTVHPVGKLPIVLEEDVLKGPGVLDMKAGLVQAIWAVKAICELNLSLNHPVQLLFNGDEEIGSRGSKDILRSFAKEAHCALILEPAVENGDVKTGRKGAQACDVVIHGKASHAGNHPEEGINAILEMAHQVIEIQKLNDNQAGTTLNVGKISGGTVSNVVPDRAEITVDLRYKTLAEKQRIQKAIEDIPCVLKGVRRELFFSEGSDPMEETSGNLALYELAKKSAQELEIPLGHQLVGGASDGNRISSLGIPILDGAGAVGKGIHALDEQIHLETYFKRISLLISLLTKI